MDQDIGYHLPCDDLPQTFPLIILKEKLIWKMLPAKFHKPFITVNEIGLYYLSVIISVHISDS